MGRWKAANVIFHLPSKYNAETKKINCPNQKK